MVEFKNPIGYLEYAGAYFVSLTKNAVTDHLPKMAFEQGKVVYTQNGRIKQTMGGIQFYASEEPFSWDYKFIKEIRDKNWNLIWQNWNYNKMK